MTKGTKDGAAAALEIARRYGGIDGSYHKNWVIDQMVRALTNCPEDGTSLAYETFVRDARAGEDGLNSYDWDTGIAP